MRKFITLFLLILGLYLAVSFINDNGNPEIKEINKVIMVIHRTMYVAMKSLEKFLSLPYQSLL